MPVRRKRTSETEIPVVEIRRGTRGASASQEFPKEPEEPKRVLPDAREAHRALMEALEILNTSMQTTSLEHTVEVGSVLWDLGSELERVITGIKETLREEAIRRLEGGTGTISLEGDDLGEVLVRVLETSLSVPRGKNIDEIKQALGADFSLFFEEVLTYKPRKDYETRMGMLTDPLRRKILLDAVEQVEHTPRVTFRRHKPSNRSGT